MNDIIRDQLDRVEKALNTLIESIASYSPSIPAASALLEADYTLNKDLKQCKHERSYQAILTEPSPVAIHQANHARILHLRQKIESQNDHITSSLTTLASTRADLLATPTSLPHKDTRNVPYADLLAYAKRISRNTVPPTSRPTLTQPQPPGVSDLTGINGDSSAVKEEEKWKEGRGTEALEDGERKWLDALSQIPFVPWVSDEVMKRGALAQIQGMVEQGINPENVGAGGVEEEKDQVGGMAETEDVARRDDGGIGEQGRVESKESKPKVFGGLDLYDPESDDD